MPAAWLYRSGMSVALAPLGVKDFDMPATPNRVWEAIQSAKQ